MPYKNNTSNLFSHLERHHKKEHQQLRKNVDSEDQVSSGLGRQPTTTEVREQQYKYLSQLVKKKHCITASSVPSERLFSSAGNLVTQKWSCLSPENVDHLVFLYENSK